MTNCVNCGAPLHGNQCMYCGTVYEGRNVIAEFGHEDWVGILKVGDREYKCYIGAVEITPIFSPFSGRDMSGKLHIEKVVEKRKFTLIEM